MGCASSKRVEAAVPVYRPPPSSFAVFDINAIEEPWLKAEDGQEKPDEKHTHVPAPIIDKLNSIDDAPRTWDEVSKALEDLKPALQNSKPKLSSPVLPPVQATSPAQNKQTPKKSLSFHTLEELDAKLSSKPKESTQLRKTESMKPGPLKPDVHKFDAAKPESEGYRPVKENIFILRDRMEREKEGKAQSFIKRDPLSDFSEKCPPGGEDKLVLYTTSLGGVRRTYEDCNKIRLILEYHRAVFDERDVSLHGEFLNELRELLGEGTSVPRMFVNGRYVGGVEEVVGLNETGKLGRILNWARVERGVGRQGCEGCGGARFVPCLECGGSCRVLVGESKERCSKCNENGLVQCPACI